MQFLRIKLGNIIGLKKTEFSTVLNEYSMSKCSLY